MADLETVQTFWNNADAHAAFLARVEVALMEEAITLREGMGAGPLTTQQEAEQEYALAIIRSPASEARRMLPALAIKANEAGLIDNAGIITATDTQIRNTVAGLVSEFSGYIAPTS